MQGEEIEFGDAVYEHEMFAFTGSGWVVAYSIFYHGESYDYIFEVAGLNETERQARDGARRFQCLHRARRNFLRDVPLDKFNDVEIKCDAS